MKIPIVFAAFSILMIAHGEPTRLDSCAVEAYRSVCRLFQKPPQETNLSEDQLANGVTLLTLSDWLKSSGFEVEGLKCRLSDLAETDKTVYIALIEGRHYVVISRLLSDSVAILDSGNPQYLMGLTTFGQEWSGVVLKIKAPSSKVIPRLALTEKAISLGVHGLSEGCRLNVSIRNISPGAVQIRHIGVSCGCLLPKAYPSAIPGNSSVTVPVDFLGKTTLGGYSVKLVFETNDDLCPYTVCDISGETVNKGAFCPILLNFGNISYKNCGSELLFIRRPGYLEKVKTFEIESKWATENKLALSVSKIDNASVRITANANKNAGANIAENSLQTMPYVWGSMLLKGYDEKGNLVEDALEVPLCAKVTVTDDN